MNTIAKTVLAGASVLAAYEEARLLGLAEKWHVSLLSVATYGVLSVVVAVINARKAPR